MPDRETAATNPFLSSPDYLDEYREMLAEQTINELRALAQARGVTLHGNRKEPIVEELAALLSAPHVVRAEIDGLGSQPDAGALLSILTYLHLTLAPGYGLSADSIADLLIQKRWAKNRNVVRNQLKKLHQRGLLLNFRHRKVIYYTLPEAVRVCLPSRPKLVPAYPAEKSGRLQARGRPSVYANQMLYAIWEHVDQQQPRRRPAPPRQPVENEWPELREWSHLPSEIQAQTSYGFTRGRQTRSSTLSMRPFTIPVPAYRLGDADLDLLAQTFADVGATGAEPTRNVRDETDFFYALLATLGAISGEPGEPILSHKERFQQFLKLPPAEQARVILYAWATTTSWSEMEMVLRSVDDMRLRRNHSYASFKPQHLYQDWRAARQAVLRFLSVLEQDRWFSVDGLLRTVYEFVPRLLHTHSDRSMWWIESLRTKKQFGTTFDDWQQSCGRFARAILTGPLFWLGGVVLGYADQEGLDRGEPVAFKLTPVGSLALGKEETLVESVSQSPHDAILALNDDMTIEVLPSRAPAELHNLFQNISDLVLATPERFVYQVTADGVKTVLDQGETVESIVAALGELAGKDVPTSWLDQMRTWSANHGKLHVYDELAVVELADDYALVELLANTSLRDAIVHQFSPRLLAIRPEAVDTLVEQMEKRGYTPRVE